MPSSDTGSLLSDSDVEYIAEEVQQLNQDVIQSVETGDDLINSNLIARTITAGRTNNDDSEADLDKPYIPEESRRPSTFSRRPSTFTRRPTITESLKRTTTFQKLAKFSWWDSEFKRDRIKVYYEFLTNYILLSIILLVVLAIYWGSYYGRENRYSNLKILVVNDDLEVDGIIPIIGNSVNTTANLETVKKYGGWELYTHDEFSKIASKHNNTIYEEVVRQVHHQHYWAAIYVKPNISSILYQAIQSNDTAFNVTGNLVEAVYETGRDFLTMSSYVSKFLLVFEKAYLSVVKQEYSIMVNQLDSTESKLVALSFFSKPFSFYYNDMVPISGAILLAPLQLGLTYLVVFAFFNLIMTIRIQIYISTLVTGLKYVMIKIAVSQISYAILSLGYLLVNLAFQIDTAATFGRSGALVLWAIGFLTMSSLGSLNENVALLLFTYYPKMIGGWLVFLMVVNMAPTVSALALTNKFYRYGYAMPIHNSYEAAKVVFSNIYKGQLGRNIGILVAWIVICNLALPFTLVHVAKVKARREAEAEFKAKEELEKVKSSLENSDSDR